MMNRSKTSSYSFGYKLSGSVLIFTLAFALLSLKPMRHYDIEADSFVVVIDAGHGGKDHGVTSEDAHLKEKDIVLDIITELSKKGDNNVSYVFTREKDENVSLTDRVKLAEDVNADLLISVHVNNHPDKAINGVEIYYSKENPYLEKTKGYSKQFANGLKLGEGKNVIKAENLYVTREAVCPSVYLGLGFLSSDKDAEYLSSQKNREDIANQIHQVVKEFSRM